MRERAERAQLEHQALTYEQQRQQQRSSLERFDQQQEYYRQSNTINAVNQAANAAANIALHHRRNGTLGKYVYRAREVSPS